MLAAEIDSSRTLYYHRIDAINLNHSLTVPEARARNGSFH